MLEKTEVDGTAVNGFAIFLESEECCFKKRKKKKRQRERNLDLFAGIRGLLGKYKFIL